MQQLGQFWFIAAVRLGSNQIDSEPQRFKLSLYDAQFVVLYLVVDQLLMHLSYQAGITR